MGKLKGDYMELEELLRKHYKADKTIQVLKIKYRYINATDPNNIIKLNEVQAKIKYTRDINLKIKMYLETLNPLELKFIIEIYKYRKNYIEIEDVIKEIIGTDTKSYQVIKNYGSLIKRMLLNKLLGMDILEINERDDYNGENLNNRAK